MNRDLHLVYRTIGHAIFLRSQAVPLVFISVTQGRAIADVVGEGPHQTPRGEKVGIAFERGFQYYRGSSREEKGGGVK